MTKEQNNRMKRLALDTLIEQRNHRLDRTADVYGDLAWHVEQEHCTERNCSIAAEYKWQERELNRVTDDCVQLARECVPVHAIFALPAWIRERIGEAVPVRY